MWALGVITLVPLLAAISGSPSPQPSAAAIPLSPRTTVEDTVSGTDRDTFEIAMHAGECATLTIDQRGTDLVIRILDANGGVAASIDDEVRTGEVERFAFVADDTRTYRLTVGARYPRLTSARPYAIWIESVSPATEKDRALYDARKLFTEAGTLRSSGKFDDTLARATKALTLAEGALGPDAPFVTLVLGTIAGTERSKGRLREAEETWLRAIGAAERSLGPDHPLTAGFKESLGVMYNAMDDFAKAEPLMVEGTRLTERALGEHPRLATCLMDLALLHTNRGDTTRALEELQRALQVSDRTIHPDDFASIAIVNNLGDLYVNLKQFDKAQPLVERAVRDLERTLGPDNFRVATPLLNLGIIMREKGQYGEALRHLQRSYDLRAKTYGPEHTDPASILISIGNVHHAQKQYAEALERYQAAHDVLEKTAGPYHNLTLMTINNAARTYAAMGDLTAALRERSRVETIVDKAIGYNLAIGSDREKLAFLDQTFERMGRTISLHLRQMPDSAEAADLAATSILHRKGRVLDASLDSRAALRERLDPDDRALLDELASATRDLSTLALSGPGRTAPADYTKRLAALEQRHEALESQISRRSAAFRAEMDVPRLSAVRAAIPAGAALIEFIVYEPFDPAAATDDKAHGDRRYAAYVIRRDAPTRGVDLGSAKDVDAAIGRLRDALRDPGRPDVTSLSRAVDRLVLGHVRPLAAGAAHLLIAPDGALNLLPFEALVDERGRFQVQRSAISYVGSGRELLRMQVPRTAASDPLVLADPAFGEPPAGASTGSLRDSASSSSRGTVYFSPLVGTAREASAIQKVLRSAKVLTGGRATKSALLEAQGPSVLHVATHAFFLAGRDAPRAPVSGTRAMSANVQSDNPLLRSGIALAGANLSRTSDAGIVTALEASALNLRGTRLVTLSACDTGVGEVKNGEGVYGLRRAFFLAGAETVVMSLWPVSDYVTRTVMTDYYAGLSRGQGRGAALRRVQLAMIADPARRHPFYWAAFIQAGDWTPLPVRW